MKTLSLAVVTLTLATAAPALAQSDAPGSNPILRDKFTADPAALVSKGRVYLYVGEDVSTGTQRYVMPHWLAYSSKDMKTWTPHGVVLKPTDFKWARSDAYASQVVERKGKFYFYSTAKQQRPATAMGIGVAVSDSPLGPFVDVTGKPLITNEMTPQGKHDWSDIDPTVFTDDDGTSWLMWGNENLFQVKLKPNMIELDGPIQEVKVDHYLEGPWLHKRGKLYYLTYASLDKTTQKDEHLSYATAPSMQGPWTSRGVLTGPAENSFTIHPAIITFKGRDYVFYHNGAHTIDGVKGGEYRRSVAVERIVYNRDGTIRPVIQTKAGVSGKR